MAVALESSDARDSIFNLYTALPRIIIIIIQNKMISATNSRKRQEI